MNTNEQNEIDFLRERVRILEKNNSELRYVNSDLRRVIESKGLTLPAVPVYHPTAALFVPEEW